MALYKYSDWTMGQLEAVLNVLGEETAKALIAGELTVEQFGATLVVKEATKTLLDKHGRRIPPKGLVSAVCDANRKFRLVQPEFDLSWTPRLALLEQVGLPVALSTSDFVLHAQTLIAKVRKGEQTKNLLNGVHLPIVIPQTGQTEVSDLGETTEAFVAAAEKSYRQKFPRRSFTNYRKGELAGQVSVVGGSRYEKLLERLAKESVVALYFPNPLQGFSVHAQREQMASLLEEFILSGPLDTAMGWVMYPDVLGRDFYTPVNDCSAVQWQSAEWSLCFRAHDDGARFARKGSLALASGSSSGGLLFLG